MKRSTNHKRKGIALVWMAMVFIFILALMGLMLSWGWGFIAVHQIQNAADAAALAGARFVPLVYDPNDPDGDYLYIAKDVAQDYGVEHISANLSVYLDEATDVNLEDFIDGKGDPIPVDPYDDSLTDDIYIGRYIDDSGLFFIDHVSPNAMMVIARREGADEQPLLGLMFGSLPGVEVESARFKRYAIAKIDPDWGAGILALGECCDCPGITFSGGGSVDDLTVYGGGSLYSNSCNENSIAVDGNISVDITAVYTVGGIDEKFYNQKNDLTDTEVQQNPDPEPDPYRYPDGEQPLPDHNIEAIRAMYDNGTITDANDAQTLSPGYYSGGFQLHNAEITLLSGDYYLDSIGQAASLSMTGGKITGTNVTLHIIGDADFGLNVNGGDLDISTRDSGTYKGVGIYQKRDPNYDCDQSCTEPWEQAFPMSEFNGNGIIDVRGAVYMPHNRLELNGSGQILLERVIADRFYISGNGEKVVNYKGVRKISPQSWLVK